MCHESERKDQEMLFVVGYQKIQFCLGPLYVVKFVVLSSTFFLVIIGHVTIEIQKEVENIVVITIDIKEEVGVFIIPFKIEKEIKKLEKTEIMQKKPKFEWHTKTNPRIHNQILKCL